MDPCDSMGELQVISSASDCLVCPVLPPPGRLVKVTLRRGNSQALRQSGHLGKVASGAPGSPPSQSHRSLPWFPGPCRGWTRRAGGHRTWARTCGTSTVLFRGEAGPHLSLLELSSLLTRPLHPLNDLNQQDLLRDRHILPSLPRGANSWLCLA